MSGRRSISNSFNVITVDDPVSVVAQYAPNDNPSSSQIHDTWQNGDLYMRTKSTEDGATWSSWQKIVGESGGETDYTFGISAYKTTSNASTAPSDISSWSDAPLEVTSAQPYLWAKVQKKSWNASTQSYNVDSTTYIRLTGEDGSSVMAQYAPNDNPSSSQIHDTWQSGDLYMRTKSTTDSNWSSWHKIVGESGDETDYTFAISQYKTTSSATTAPSDISSSDWLDAPVAVTSSKPYLWSRVQKKEWNESTQSYIVSSTSYICLTGESAATYNLVPSVSEIVLTKSGTYSPERFSCYCTSLKNGVSTNNPSEATMQYSYNDSSWTAFSSTSSFLSSNVQQNGGKFYIRLLVNEKVMDKKTLSVVVDGDDGVSYCFVFTKAAASVDENNLVTAELAGYAYKYVGGVRSALTSTTIRFGYILTDPDTYATTTTNSSGFFDTETWFNNNDITGYGKNSPSIFAAIIIDGTVVHAEMITISKKGSTGNRGKVGRFFYYAEEWNDYASTDSFLVNDAQAPYFHYNNNYWVFNPETNGTYTKQDMGTPSTSSSNWKLMTSDFKYIITEAIFGRYAHFGSFIINDDWLISQHGVIYDTNGGIHTIDANHSYGDYNVNNAYTLFEADYPNSSKPNANNFVPNFAVDGLTGKTYQNDAYIRGEVYATSGEFTGKVTATSGEFTGKITATSGEFTGVVKISSSSGSLVVGADNKTHFTIGPSSEGHGEILGFAGSTEMFKISLYQSNTGNYPEIRIGGAFNNNFKLSKNRMRMDYLDSGKSCGFGLSIYDGGSFYLTCSKADNSIKNLGLSCDIDYKNNRVLLTAQYEQGSNNYKNAWPLFETHNDARNSGLGKGTIYGLSTYVSPYGYAPLYVLV